MQRIIILSLKQSATMWCETGYLVQVGRDGPVDGSHYVQLTDTESTVLVLKKKLTQVDD